MKRKTVLLSLFIYDPDTVFHRKRVRDYSRRVRLGWHHYGAAKALYQSFRRRQRHLVPLALPLNCEIDLLNLICLNQRKSLRLTPILIRDESKTGQEN
jgi:hypothetical protein